MVVVVVTVTVVVEVLFPTFRFSSISYRLQQRPKKKTKPNQTNKKDPNPKQSLLAFTTLCLQQLVWPLERIARALRTLIPESAVPQVSRTVQIWASQLNPLVGQGALLRVPYPLGPYSSREDLITKSTASSKYE